MKSFISFLFIILLTYPLISHAEENSKPYIFKYEKEILLRGGGNATYGSTKLFDRSSTSFWGGGTHVVAGFRYKNYELNIATNAYWGKVKPFTSEMKSTSVTGKAVVRTFILSIYPKYFFKTLYAHTWRPYIGAGITWSQHTLKMKEYTTNRGEFNDINRMAYLSAGGTIVFGIEEFLKFKEMNPVYMEIQYSFTRAHKISKLDSSNHKEIESIDEEDVEDNTYSHTLMINMGMTIF